MNGSCEKCSYFEKLSARLEFVTTQQGSIEQNIRIFEEYNRVNRLKIVRLTNEIAILRNELHSLDANDVEERHFPSVMISIKKSSIERFKEQIDEYDRKIVIEKRVHAMFESWKREDLFRACSLAIVKH